MLSQHPLVSSVEADLGVGGQDILPDDPSFPDEVGLHNTGQSNAKVDADIDSTLAWGTTTGSSDVVVAIVDSGVDYLHLDLVNNIWVNPGEVAGNGIDDDNNGFIDDVHGYDFHANDADPMDENRHGTHVAGIVAASGNNGMGMTGVSWSSTIIDLPPDLVPLLMREFQVSGSSVFWWVERSGILQNTVGRKRGRSLVAESTMWSPVVVVKTPTVNHPASVRQPEEQLPVEQLVAKLSVE